MNFLQKMFGMVSGRIDHVPAKDIPEVLGQYNSELPAGAVPITEADWRRFEECQVLYTAGRIVRQATPHNLPPAVGQFINQAIPVQPPPPSPGNAPGE